MIAPSETRGSMDLTGSPGEIQVGAADIGDRPK
jgi:hypothetical protein